MADNVDPVEPAKDITVVQNEGVTPVVLTPVGNPDPPTVPNTPVIPEPKSDAIDPTDPASTLRYKDKDLDFAVDKGLTKQFAEKGIDINIALEELTSSKDFTLSKGLKAKFDKVYGKDLVDGYITGLKSQLDGYHTEMSQADTDSETRTAKALEETYEQVGGEEKWNDLASWLVDGNGRAAVSDEELKSFNEVMQSGNRYAQKLAIDNMMKLQNSEQGDIVDLIKSDASISSKDWLSMQEYHELVGTREGVIEYNKNPQKYDAMRNRAIDRGL